MTSYHYQMLGNIFYNRNMRYQVCLINQSLKNGQIPQFWLFFAKIMLIMHNWLIMHDLLPLNVENILYYQNMQYQVDPTDQTPENDQKPLFGSMDHSKTHFRDFWMILHDLVTLLNVEKHFVLSLYAISGPSEVPKSRKWQKTVFMNN